MIEVDNNKMVVNGKECGWSIQVIQKQEPNVYSFGSQPITVFFHPLVRNYNVGMAEDDSRMNEKE